MLENVCHFVPHHKDYNSIHIINFVFETNPVTSDTPITQAFYRMGYVCSGQGNIITTQLTKSLKHGDIFFTFPGSPFKLEVDDEFTYMYISFLGTRANMILEQLKISTKNFHFENCESVEDMWKNGILVPSQLSDLISESVLLYSFTHIGLKTTDFKNKKSFNNASLHIKKYIDDNFSNPDFSIETISNYLSYNKKYISTIFKKEMKIGIIEYLNTVRIQNACTLIEQGFTSVNDIAHCCGFTDAQYFTKVFKKKMDISPIKYINQKK